MATDGPPTCSGVERAAECEVRGPVSEAPTGGEGGEKGIVEVSLSVFLRRVLVSFFLPFLLIACAHKFYVNDIPLPLHLPPHPLELLQDLLVGQQPLPHQHPSCGILLHHHRPEEFLEGDDLAWVEFLGHLFSPLCVHIPNGTSFSFSFVKSAGSSIAFTSSRRFNPSAL